jgi:hypothetical protein
LEGSGRFPAVYVVAMEIFGRKRGAGEIFSRRLESNTAEHGEPVAHVDGYLAHDVVQRDWSDWKVAYD